MALKRKILCESSDEQDNEVDILRQFLYAQSLQAENEDAASHIFRKIIAKYNKNHCSDKKVASSSKRSYSKSTCYAERDFATSLRAQTNSPLKLVDLIVCLSLISISGYKMEAQLWLKARDLLLNAENICSTHPLVLLNLANCYRELGENNLAIEYYLKIVSFQENEKGCDVKIDSQAATALLKESEVNPLKDLILQPLDDARSFAISVLCLLYNQTLDFENADRFAKMLGIRLKLSNEAWKAIVDNETVVLDDINMLPFPFQDVFIINDCITSSWKYKLKHIFNPKASFWRATDYRERGYFSFWYDLSHEPTNIVEEFIHDLFGNRQVESFMKKQDIVGCEWWVHTRPSGRSLGHQLHFDTDEATLQLHNQLIHPKYSSVFYITCDENSGNTIVFDTSSDDILKGSLGKNAAIFRPSESSAIFFPGNLLHGVLPKLGPNETNSKTKVHVKHRLVLLIGFWQKDLSKIGKRRFLGPASYIPRRTRHNDFLDNLNIATDLEPQPETFTTNKKKKINGTSFKIVKSWDNVNSGNIMPKVELHSDVDQRFFITNLSEFIGKLTS